MILNIGALFWVVVTVSVARFLANRVFNYTHHIIFLVLRDDSTAVNWTALIFLPGTVLHEAAHWLLAVFFLFPIAGFTVWPKRDNDGVILGQVSYRPRSNFIPFRSSIIGIAPFFIGIGAILLICQFILQIKIDGVSDIASTPEALIIAFNRITETDNPWLWIYLLFSIGNMMFTSAADRNQWGTSGIILSIFIIALIYFGYQQFLFEPAISLFNNFSGYIMLALAMTIAIDIVVLPILWFIYIIMDSLVGPPS